MLGTLHFGLPYKGAFSKLEQLIHFPLMVGPSLLISTTTSSCGQLSHNSSKNTSFPIKYKRRRELA